MPRRVVGSEEGPGSEDAGTEGGAALSRTLAVVVSLGEREGFIGFCLCRLLGLGGDMGVGDTCEVTV